jgi:glycosyltransferase involved in cell wall biosynthesis
MPADNAPQISICIPAYNQTKYLDILIRSIQDQSFRDFEIIVSDDSKTDDVSNYLRKYNFGNQLKYFRNQPSLGSPENWNAAIAKATGKYIKIMHHDDAFTNPSALEEMFHFMESNNYDYIFCDTKVENLKDPDKSRIHRIKNLSKTIRKPYLIFFGNPIGSPSTSMIKREKFPSLQYDKNYIWLVDMEYYARLFKASSRGNNIPKPLILTYYSSEEQISMMALANFELQIKEQAMLYDRMHTEAPAWIRFFMQVSIVRLFYRGKIKDKKAADYYSHVPGLLKTYFSLLKIKPLYFAYYIFIRAFDWLRKGLV